MIERLDVFVEITRPRRAATERMHFRSREAIEVVELHRRQRRAQVHQLFRRGVQFSALVIRADDEVPEVPLTGGLDCRPVQVIDVIPMDVDDIELTAVETYVK